MSTALTTEERLSRQKSRDEIRGAVRGFLGEPIHSVRIGAASPPPDSGTTWLPTPRFFLGQDPAPRLQWPSADGVTEAEIGPGTVLFLPARSWNRADRRKPRRNIGIVLHSSYVRFLLLDHPGDGKWHAAARWYHTATPAPPTVQDLLARVDGAPPEAQRAYLLAALHCLANHLDEDTAVESSISELLFRSVCGYIDDHIGSLLDRGTVAAAFDRHPTHISRLFKTHGNCTFQEYLTRTRLEHARELLLHTNGPIKAIASACGYETQSHFGTLFRKRYGAPPAAYRAGTNAERP